MRNADARAGGERSEAGAGLATHSLEAGDAVFAGLAMLPAMVLAVSGGPDSMALLHLVANWARTLGGRGPRLHVATVDHGLRPEARDEARLVASAAAALGLPHATLVWEGGKPATRIQERARRARYALLAEHAAAVGATAILTAHHADDQAETVLLRLGRGSGIGGLGGMERESALAPGLALVRPFLAIPKQDLVTVCRRAGQSFAEDPSNRDMAFARVRLRAQAAPLAALGLDAAGLSRLARRMARADAALEAEAERLEASLEPLRDEGRYRACLAPARTAETEILLRVLRRAIAHVVPDRAFLRLERLETLTQAIEAALRDCRDCRSTLGGARVALTGDAMMVVSREQDRRRGRPPAQVPSCDVAPSGVASSDMAPCDLAPSDVAPTDVTPVTRHQVTEHQVTRHHVFCRD